MNPRLKNWRGRCVWLVGASDGIGATLAVSLDALGARLILSARSQEGLQRTAARLQLPALIVPCDVSQPDEVEDAWQRILGQWGGVDLVIYLAGVYSPLDAATPAAELLPLARQTMAVNFGGALEVVSRVAPWLIAQSGQSGGWRRQGPQGLVLVSSVAGYRGLPKALAYSASKAALSAYADSLYHDLAPHGLGVWLVNPGFVATRLTAGNDFRMPALISVDKAVEEIIDGLASGRFEIHFPRRFSRFLKLLALLPDRWFFAIMRRVAAADRAASS